jgi:predicted bacteriocin transport accessory protein
MKKILFILAAIALVLTGCTSGGPTKIKAKEMTKLLDADETLVLYVGLSVCSACKIYKPVVTEVMKNYDVKVYYVESDTDDVEDVKTLIDKHLGDVQYTPTTLIFEDGVLVDSKVGALDYLALKNWFVKNGVITE